MYIIVTSFSSGDRPIPTTAAKHIKKRKASSDGPKKQTKRKEKAVPKAKGKNKSWSILAESSNMDGAAAGMESKKVEGIALEEWEQHFNETYTYNSIGDDGMVVEEEDEEKSV